MKSRPSCVLLAEPHPSLADGIRCPLATLFDAVVMVAEESSLTEAVGRLHPDLAVVELSLANGDLAGLTERLRRRSPDLKILLLGDDDGASLAESVLPMERTAFSSSIRSQLRCCHIESLRRGERIGSATADGL